MSTTPNFVNPTSQLLLDSEFSQSVKWNERTLTDKSSSQSLSWQNRIGYNADGNESLNWSSTTLFDTSKVQALIWKNRAVYDGEGEESLNWNDKSLLGSWSVDPGTENFSICTYGQMVSASGGGSGSVSFPLDSLNTNLSLLQAHASSQKVLISSAGATLIGTDDLEEPYIQEPVDGNGFGFVNGNPTVTGDLALTGVVVDETTSGSIDFNNRLFVDANNTPIVEWVGSGSGGTYTAGFMFAPQPGFGLLSIVNWPGVPSASVDPNFFYLNDVSGNTSVDWTGRLLHGDWGIFGTIVDGEQTSSIDVNGRTLYDGNAYPVLQWGTAAGLQINSPIIANSFIDGASFNVIDLVGRTLYAADGSARVHWSGSNTIVVGQLVADALVGDGSQLINVPAGVPLKATTAPQSLIQDQYGDDIFSVDSNYQGHFKGDFGSFGFDPSGSAGSPNINGKLYTNSTSSVADGTYTIGIGTTTNGTITVQNGIIVSIQEAT